MAEPLVFGHPKRPPKEPQPKFSPVLMGAWGKPPKKKKDRIPATGTPEQALIAHLKKEHEAALMAEEETHAV